MCFVKILLYVLAGIVIGALVAFFMIFLGVLGAKFTSWLSKKFNL